MRNMDMLVPGLPLAVQDLTTLYTWTPEQLPLVNAAVAAYEAALDNWNYQITEHGLRDVRGVCWANGQIFGAAKALAQMVGKEEHAFVPLQIREAATRFQV